MERVAEWGFGLYVRNTVAEWGRKNLIKMLLSDLLFPLNSHLVKACL